MTATKVGYARTSTLDQKAGLEAQERELRGAGCTKLFVEQVSSVDVAKRDQLDAALDYVREGDTLVCTKLDRLARSTRHLLDLLDKLSAKGVSLLILDMGVNTGGPTGKLLLTLLGGIATWERDIMLERQREGIAKAKAEGRYKGRAPTAMRQADQIKVLAAAGMTKSAIAIQLSVSERSVYRALSEAGGAKESDQRLL
jgi:DNA invertase Pin-like site-specific DNA recombinase